MIESDMTEITASGPDQGERGWPEAGLAYNRLALDRAAGRRDDPAWVQAVRGRPGSRVIAFWNDKCLTQKPPGPERQPVVIPAAEAEPVLAAAAATVLLGLDGEAGVFAADLSPLPLEAAAGLAGAAQALDVRALFSGLDPQLAATLGYARGILRWNREQRFCGACGRRPPAAAAAPSGGAPGLIAAGCCSRGSSRP